jgi:hypothetical protein|tara:strand:- start:1126 stop:1266 length:141 start_codon:yes stop_codon:yes gene_type:complete
MNTDVTEARKAFETEMRRLTGKPCQQTTERLIDLIVAVRDELRKNL